MDNEARIQAQIRRHMENSRLSRAQRYRLANAAQRYSVFTDLWRRKSRIKDRGYERPEDKLLGVGGFGHLDAPQPQPNAQPDPDLEQSESFLLLSSDVFEVAPLYEAMMRAREMVGKSLGAFDSFAAFVQFKTDSIRSQFKCDAVEYTVMVKGGQVHLKARPRSRPEARPRKDV